jgi:hypothetical protein
MGEWSGEWRRLADQAPPFDHIIHPRSPRHLAESPEETAMPALATIAKALTAGLAGASAAAVTAAQDGTVTGAEWVTILAAAVVAGYAVYRVPNAEA